MSKQSKWREDMKTMGFFDRILGYKKSQTNKEPVNENALKISLPTEKGIQLGISAERRSNSTRCVHMLLIYGRQAQEYIVQNMRVILSGEVASQFGVGKT